MMTIGLICSSKNGSGACDDHDVCSHMLCNAPNCIKQYGLFFHHASDMKTPSYTNFELWYTVPTTSHIPYRMFLCKLNCDSVY